ncbi:unnamed protein product, partial [Trichobilharzia regenti]
MDASVDSPKPSSVVNQLTSTSGQISSPGPPAHNMNNNNNNNNPLSPSTSSNFY